MLGLGLFLPLTLPAQQPVVPGAGELQIALQKLSVLGSVLYVGAHPDDENTAVLAYLSKGRKYRTAYLSVTRGEGGQNLIGPERGVEIGLIRTQELLAARRIDGAEQYFTRAVDFGFSKTAEETLGIWGKEETLGDIVWVIRKFRPDVIISRAAQQGPGSHGHHVATAILIREAFDAAADPQRFPDQLKSVPVWKTRRLLWNVWRPNPGETKGLLSVDTGEYNPLLGRSYSEIAAESRSQHKIQGFGSAARRGSRPDYYEVAAGDPAAADIFEGIDVSWSRIAGGEVVGKILAESRAAFDPGKPSKSIPGLIDASVWMEKLPDADWVRVKREELLGVIRDCAGLWMEAIADDYAAAPGDAIRIKTTVINRSGFPLTLHRLGFPGVGPDSVPDLPLENNKPLALETTVRLPKDFPISQPYWLGGSGGREQPAAASVSPDLRGRAEDPPAVSAAIELQAEGRALGYSVPVLFRWTDDVRGELYRPFEVRPRVTVQVAGRVGIFPDTRSRKIRLRIKSHSADIAGVVRLEGPAAWKVSPSEVPFALQRKYDEVEVAFDVSPPPGADASDLRAKALAGGQEFDRALVEISYPHIHRQVYFPESRLRVVRLDVRTEGKRLGYVMGAGDDVPQALEDLGYEVSPLSDAMLEEGDLSAFDAVVTGVRDYNTREALRAAKGALLRYVENGGTLVVQYNVAADELAGSIGPYPLTVGRDRVTVENAPVAFLLPDHPLLNFPNRISAADFEGWVQERGLYFAAEWDGRYETPLGSHDPGEPERKGGLLYARYGKGVFIYTAFSWFRELPAGVPGAFRIFANLISAGKSAGRSAHGQN